MALRGSGATASRNCCAGVTKFWTVRGRVIGIVFGH